jgi:hypothetical protein
MDRAASAHNRGGAPQGVSTVGLRVLTAGPDDDRLVVVGAPKAPRIDGVFDATSTTTYVIADPSGSLTKRTLAPDPALTPTRR